jgi:hypothetical protein
MTATKLNVYLDETGTFNADAQRCAIGGYRAPRPVTHDEARQFWAAVLGEAPDDFHTTERSYEERARLVPAVITEMGRREWTPVIFEHLTRAFIVDNPTTYVYVFADGLTRLGRLATFEVAPPLTLDVLAACRSVPGADNVRVRMEPEIYARHLQERIEFERARAGARKSELSWDWRIAYASGTRDPRLWLSDFICNCWGALKKIPLPAREEFRAFVRPHTIAVFQADDHERIQLLLGRQEYGAALLDLLALSNGHSADPTLTATMIRTLAALDGRTLENALTVPLFRIEHDVERRHFDAAEKSLRKFEEPILDGLERALGDRVPELAWARAHALNLALTAANHRGAVIQAEAVLERLRPLRAELSSQFERLPQVLHSMLNEAVHLSNTYDFLASYRKMLRLGDELLDTAGFFCDLLGAASAVRADAVGKTFGTALQAAIHAARRDPSLYDEARRLSDRARPHFVRQDDRARQASYRCQLETDAGDLESALAWLRDALDIPDATLDDLVARAAQGSRFDLMHVARIWEAAARLGHDDLAARIQAAWDHAGIPHDPYWTRHEPHPQAVILWKWGAAQAYRGQRTAALARLDTAVAHLEAGDENITLRSIALGVRAERLALLVGERESYARDVRAFAARLEALTGPSMPEAQKAWFAPWSDRLGALRQPTDPARARAAWRSMAWDVPY